MFEVSPKQLGYFGSSQVIYTNLHSAFLVHGTVECSFSGSRHLRAPRLLLAHFGLSGRADDVRSAVRHNHINRHLRGLSGDAL